MFENTVRCGTFFQGGRVTCHFCLHKFTKLVLRGQVPNESVVIPKFLISEDWGVTNHSYTLQLITALQKKINYLIDTNISQKKHQRNPPPFSFLNNIQFPFYLHFLVEKNLVSFGMMPPTPVMPRHKFDSCWKTSAVMPVKAGTHLGWSVEP